MRQVFSHTPALALTALRRNHPAARPQPHATASRHRIGETEIYIHTRIAADAVGATKMDRPEWVDVHPTTGELYITMTNNSNLNKFNSSGSKVVKMSNNNQNGSLPSSVVKMKMEPTLLTSSTTKTVTLSQIARW